MRHFRVAIRTGDGEKTRGKEPRREPVETSGHESSPLAPRDSPRERVYTRSEAARSL